MTGFDYRLGVSRDLSLADWRMEIATIVAAGGRRRVENNETFAHASGGAMVLEVFGTVSSGKLPIFTVRSPS